MRIATTPQGQTYTGFSDLLTIREWDDYVQAKFQGRAYPNYAEQRAKALGGRKYKGKKFGKGFIFPHHTEQSLKKQAQEMYPQLFK